MEIAEIIRRRLFDSPGDPKEVRRAAKEYAQWVIRHREQLPTWFPADQAQQVFETTYPFHPVALSVFERKWQSLPKFQRTRGVLRMLALWVSQLYRDSFTGAFRDPLLGLGTAPLGDSLFRAAIFDQLGEQRLEAAVLSDIAGEQAHAIRLDASAPDVIKRARLHQKVAASIFFESSGGQVKEWATLPEIRLAVSEPELDLGNIETALDALDCCYYLRVEGTRYWFSHAANIKKLLADRRATIADDAVEECVRETVRRVFSVGTGFDRRYFPEVSSDIPDSAVLTLVVMAPDKAWEASRRETTKKEVTTLIQEYGTRSRTFKSGLIFLAVEKENEIVDNAKNMLALESLEDDIDRLNLEEAEQKDLVRMTKRAEEDLKESVWRAYRHVLLLHEGNGLREVDLGLQHSSAAPSLIALIQARLKQEGLLEEQISPDFLVRYWPPALTSWSTRAVRDTFYASPKFPRLIDWAALRKTIAEGVSLGRFGYASLTASGIYEHVRIGEIMGEADVEFSDEVVLLTKEVAELAKAGAELGGTVEVPIPGGEAPTPVEPGEPPAVSPPVIGVRPYTGLQWEGQVSWQKWGTFYTKVLAKFANDPTLTLNIRFSVSPEEGLSQEKADDTRASLRDLGLSESMDLKERETGTDS